MGIKPQEEVGVVNLQILKKYPPHSPKDYAELVDEWPTPYEIWDSIPDTSIHTPDKQFLSSWPDNSMPHLAPPTTRLTVDGRWLPLDVAFHWAQKRGSGQSKTLKHDVNDRTDEYGGNIRQYNENMQKYLKSYLIPDPLTNSQVIYMATSFQTEKSIYYPVFTRFQFDTDLNQWKANALERNPEFQENLIELKAYRTGRSRKIGLFTDADAVSTIGYNTWKHKRKNAPFASGIIEKGDYPLFSYLFSERSYDENDDYDTGRAELKDLTHKGVFKVNQYFADQQNRFSWIAWNQDKTLTNKKNRNQIYIWIPNYKEKYENPRHQLGLLNWSSAFWERKD